MGEMADANIEEIDGRCDMCGWFGELQDWYGNLICRECIKDIEEQEEDEADTDFLI